MIPKDPVILLSYLNTLLRDRYPSLETLCADLELDSTEITEKLAALDYAYDASQNQFR
ncbi:MAG: DUF4250 domain-containing protein [Lachnospiraceae bacterium]|nr:DUF4250 domain-containing protein [Lachnospiraceae bacterium]MCI8995920.1 DUF4250 domain-containing protein [Lachnospiraceae bacterium]MCI9133907.1 DUF4250 domain-containing protein [Lachnospiraceae bacterium]